MDRMSYGNDANQTLNELSIWTARQRHYAGDVFKRKHFNHKNWLSELSSVFCFWYVDVLSSLFLHADYQ